MLKVSISGVRGLWEKDLTPEKITSYTRAFLEVLRQLRKNREPLQILVGADTRPSSSPFKGLVCALLQRWGVQVVDLGVVPTPLVLFSVRHLEADGGIVLTASHNPIEWNAFKFTGPEGLFFTPEQMDKVVDYEKQYTTLPLLSEKIGTITPNNSLIDQYLDKILPYFPVEKITDSKIKIVADTVNGTASSFFPIFMQRLGLQYSLLHQDPKKAFERGAEPRPENLTKLSEKVQLYKADVGFAFDPDGDRLALVNEKGQVMGENWTLALAYLCFLKYHQPKNPDIVVNLSTSILIDEIAARYKAHVQRVPVGEIHVTGRLLAQNQEIGGEGNGGVIYPALNPCRDSMIASLFILEYLTQEKRPLSSLASEFPIFQPLSLSIGRQQDKISFFHMESSLLSILKSLGLTPTEVDRQDGIRIAYEKGWIQLRASNTEPIFRIMGESSMVSKQEELVQGIRQTLAI